MLSGDMICSDLAVVEELMGFSLKQSSLRRNSLVIGMRKNGSLDEGSSHENGEKDLNAHKEEV